MRNWNFKVRSNIHEIINKLDTSLATANGFVFNIDDNKKDPIKFKLQKRGLYAFYLMFVNKIVVNGKILKTDAENETNIEISFTQYFLWKLVVFAHLFLGLAFLFAIFLGINNSAPMYILGGILLVIGVVLWIAVQKKFQKDIQEYKTLISKILEP